MELGQMVKLRAYGGKDIIRRVIQQEKGIVVVCRQEEYENARLEGREPVTVGFHMKDVIDEASPKM